MELNGNLRLIWASKRWIVLFAAVAAVAVYAISSTQPNEYESKALGQIVSSSQATGEILSEEQLLSISNVYDELAKTHTVLDRAHEEPSVKGREAEFDSSVEVSPEARVGALSFAATTKDPVRSAEFANAYANAFAGYLGDLRIEQLKDTLRPIQQRINAIDLELSETPAGAAAANSLHVELEALQEQIAAQTSSPGDTMRIIEHATPANSPVSPKPLRNGLLTLIVALALGACAVYLRDLLFDRYGSSKEVAADLDLQLLGEIPKGRSSVALEAFRSLRTAVVFALERYAETRGNGDRAGGGIVVVTGAESGCGKSHISANISRALATEGRRVIAVDGDLRRPTLHTIFRANSSPGISDLLVSDAPAVVGNAEVEVGLPRSSRGTKAELRLIPAGTHTNDSVESLSSPRMRSIVQQLRDTSDMIVVDSPPVLAVVDPVVLARYADGVVFVVDSRHTRRREARRAVEALRATGAPLLGFVFNRSNTRQSRYDAYRPRARGIQRQRGEPRETSV